MAAVPRPGLSTPCAAELLGGPGEAGVGDLGVMLRPKRFIPWYLTKWTARTSLPG